MNDEPKADPKVLSVDAIEQIVRLALNPGIAASAQTISQATGSDPTRTLAELVRDRLQRAE